MDVVPSTPRFDRRGRAVRSRYASIFHALLCVAVACAGCAGPAADEDAGETTGRDASADDSGPGFDADPPDSATLDSATPDSEVGFPPVLAFPTAEGFGAQSVGGRGGRLVVVENLNDAGPGSLRAALGLTEPRIVVFAVAGTIALSDPIRVREANSFLTIAGQSAPGEGIQISNHGIQIRDGAHDVVIRHLRIRPGLGDAPPKKNAVIVWGNDGTTVSNVILDHLTVMWCSDESVSIWGRVEATTLQWSLIAEGINRSQYEWANSMAILVGGSGAREVTQASIHHNLLADVGTRNPFIKEAALVDYRNNVVFNWNANSGIQVGVNCSIPGLGRPGPSGTFSANVNLVGNHYIRGADATATDLAWLGGADTQIFIADNWGPYCLTGCDDEWDFRWTEPLYDGVLCSDTRTQRTAPADTYRATASFDAPPIVMHPTGMLESLLLNRAGADRPSRDREDLRVIGEVSDRSGRTGMNGTHPTYASAEAPVDTDVDGMPDVWETSQGFSPSDPTDGPAFAPNGYTNVENYLNELAGDAVP